MPVSSASLGARTGTSASASEGPVPERLLQMNGSGSRRPGRDRGGWHGAYGWTSTHQDRRATHRRWVRPDSHRFATHRALMCLKRRLILPFDKSRGVKMTGICPLQIGRHTAIGIFRPCRNNDLLTMLVTLNERGRTCRASPEHQEKVVMDKNRIIGAAKEAKGAVKQAIGKATGYAKLQADGNADKVEGKVQNAIGGLNDAARHALKK